MKTRKIVALMLFSLMSISLMACSKTTKTEESTTTQSETPATTDKPAETDTASGEKVEITYAAWGGEAEINNLEATAATFNASQDRIEVKIMPIPWETYMEKLSAMATAGELPDTGLVNEAGAIKWAEEGMLYDIGEMYDANEAQPLDAVAFTYQGKKVAYSVAFETMMMFYNKDMFDAAGVDYPPTDADKAWNWDEFVEVAKKLTLDKNGKTPNDSGFDKDNIVQYGAMIENLTWQLETWCLSNGSGFYNEDGSEVIIDDPAAIDALQKIADLYLVHHVAPLSTGLTDDGVPRSLVAGTVAMTTNGAWNIGTCLAEARDEGLNYSIGILPYMEKKVTINTGGPNVVFSQTKHPEEAMEWIKWYSREENSWDALIATGIWMPILDSYYTDETMTRKWLENPAYPEYEDAKAVLVDYAMNYSQPTSWFYTNNTLDFNDLLGSVLGNVWTGKITAEQAINDNIAALKAAHSGN